MKSEELQEYIYSNIPILKANNLYVDKIENYCPEIRGNHKDHTNHRSTVFGGTISTALTVAAWSQLRLIMMDHNIEAGSVISTQTVNFLRPVDGDFKAIPLALSESEIKKIKDDMKETGRAKIDISSEVYVEGSEKIRANFTGRFVVFFE